MIVINVVTITINTITTLIFLRIHMDIGDIHFVIFPSGRNMTDEHVSLEHLVIIMLGKISYAPVILDFTGDHLF